jgi:hypothetical protein
MLGTLPTPILLDIAILFTALSLGLGFFIAERKVYLFASLAIGCFVCLFGYSVESPGAPRWAVVATMPSQEAERVLREMGVLLTAQK